MTGRTAIALAIVSAMAFGAGVALHRYAPESKRVAIELPNDDFLVADQGMLRPIYRVREIATSNDAVAVFTGAGYRVVITGEDALFLARTLALMGIRDREAGR